MNPSTHPSSAVSVPESVRLFAQQRSLGDAMNVRSERSTGSMVGIGLTVFTVGLVGSLALGAYNSAQTAARYSGHSSHTFFFPFGAMLLIGLGIAIRGMVIGTRKHFLYSGGLVHQRRSGLRAITWPEIGEVRAVYGKERGAITGYRVTGPGEEIVVPLELSADGRDSFVDHLLGFARQHNRPVH